MDTLLQHLDVRLQHLQAVLQHEDADSLYCEGLQISESRTDSDSYRSGATKTVDSKQTLVCMRGNFTQIVSKSADSIKKDRFFAAL